MHCSSASEGLLILIKMKKKEKLFILLTAFILSHILILQSPHHVTMALSDELILTLTQLKSIGFDPHWILDAGANSGTWTNAMAFHFPRTSFLMVEGNKLHTNTLGILCTALTNKQRIVLFDIALIGEEDGKRVTFYTSKMAGNPHATGASMYPENSYLFDKTYARGKTHTLTTVDVVTSHHKDVNPLQTYELLKFDVQGAEIPALMGARDVLQRAEVVILELSVVQYNRGSAQLYETMTVMRSLGFVVLDLVDKVYVDVRGLRGYHANKIPPVLAQVEAIFVKEAGKYFASAVNSSTRFRKTPLRPEIQSAYRTALCVLYTNGTMKGCSLEETPVSNNADGWSDDYHEGSISLNASSTEHEASWHEKRRLNSLCLNYHTEPDYSAVALVIAFVLGALFNSFFSVIRRRKGAKKNVKPKNRDAVL